MELLLPVSRALQLNAGLLHPEQNQVLMRNHLLTAIAVVTVLLAGIVVLYFLLEQVTEFFDESGLTTFAMLSDTSLAIVVYISVRIINRRLNGLSARQYGFDFSNTVRSFFTGITFATVFFTATLVFACLAGIACTELTGLENDWAVAIRFIIATLVVGAWEEFYFRGLLVNTLLAKKVSIASTALISSMLFTALHLFSYDMDTITPFWAIGVFILSVILFYLYIVTRSIWAPVGFHFFWDLLFSLPDPEVNELGLLTIENYGARAVQLDNVSIAITGIVLVLFMIFGRTWIRARIDLYQNKLSGDV